MEDYTHSSIVLETLQGLFLRLDPSIIVKFTNNGHTLIASNISEYDIDRITLLTNDPRNNALLNFDEIQVFLNGDFNPSPVYGLYNILSKQIILESSTAYALGYRTVQPFINGFDTGVPGVNSLVDKLSELTHLSPNTFGKVKTYRMIFSNDNMERG